MWHDHLLNTLIKTQMWFSSKKENAENNLHCKTLSSHWSFSYYKDFYTSFVSFFILGELRTYNRADHWKRFFKHFDNALKRQQSFEKKPQLYQNASLYPVISLKLQSAFTDTTIRSLQYIAILEQSSHLTGFSPLLLPKLSFPYSQFNTEIIKINSC